ncbi:MAG: metallophosphoesterase [Candidatus Omnitrophica bacterium]|nr:metallophosphoesterase [Candidatus Omnitrophota bacterium]
MQPLFQCVREREIELNDVKDIVITGDVGCTGFDDESKAVLASILRHKADIFLILGDLAFTGEKKEIQEIMDFCNKRATAPVYSLCGNHDIPGYKDFCGLSSYALIFPGIACVLLDNSTSRFLASDMEFLEKIFNKYADKKFIIFFHIPPPFASLASAMSDMEWSRIRNITDKFKDRIVCMICGHIHGFYEYIKDGYRIFITAGGGGKMLYDLPEGGSKLYHALKVSVGGDVPVEIKVIPV